MRALDQDLKSTSTSIVANNEPVSSSVSFHSPVIGDGKVYTSSVGSKLSSFTIENLIKEQTESALQSWWNGEKTIKFIKFKWWFSKKFYKNSKSLKNVW